MTKVGFIKLDLHDCTEEDEKRFRVHGFDDMLDTDNIVEATNFIAEQAYALLSIHSGEEVDVLYGEVTADHPLSKFFMVHLDGEMLTHCIRANDITGEAITMYMIDGKPVYETHQGVIKIRLDDNTKA